MKVQSQDSLILTTEANALWLDKFKNLDKNSTLQVLRDRLIQDTAVYISDSFYVCGFMRKQGERAWIKIKDSTENRMPGIGKPSLIVEGNLINNGNNVQPSEVLQLVSLLASVNIKSVELLDKIQSSALVGKRASAGVFIIKLSRTKDKKHFNKLMLKQSS